MSTLLLLLDSVNDVVDEDDVVILDESRLVPENLSVVEGAVGFRVLASSKADAAVVAEVVDVWVLMFCFEPSNDLRCINLIPMVAPDNFLLCFVAAGCCCCCCCC